MRRAIFRRTNLPAALALLVVAVGWIVAENQARKTHGLSQRAEVSTQVAMLRADLEGIVNGTIQLVRGLIATIATEPEMEQDRFAELASQLIDDQLLLRNLGAAPDMILQMMYPIEGNEQAIGLNYITHPVQREAALRARDLGELILAGPVDLVQGGRGFVGRFPVFVSDGNDTHSFWGLVSAVMDVDVLYELAGLNDNMPISISLRGRDATGAEGPAFFGPEITDADDPVFAKVQLPSGAWQIAAIPHGGWERLPPTIWATRALLLLGACLILIPSIQMGRLMAQRSDAIRGLRDANNTLTRQMSDLEAARAAQEETTARLAESLQLQQEVASRFENVAEISNSWVWEQDADLRFVHVSGAFERLTGVRADYILGKTNEQIIASRPDIRESADWDELYRRIAAREAFSGFVFRQTSENGQFRWFQLSGTPIFDDKGHFAGYRGAGMDVTEMQAARAAAEEANRAKSMFLANMSHEIRTPLNGVLGMAEALRDVLSDPEHKTMADTIRGSGEGLMHVLNDILDISKIEAGKMRLDNTVFYPADVVARVAELHRPGLIEKGLALHIDTGPDAPLMRRGDAHRLGQILHNLLDNAGKFTETGEIRLSLANAPGGNVLITVRDSGIGMTPDQMGRMFEDFVQADGTITRRYGGTGLGMSIVRRLVWLMGGTITVDSALGRGTEVRLSIPFPPAEQSLKPDQPCNIDLTGLRLLVADDTRTNLIVVKALLRDSGATVTVVENGAEAVKAWASGQFDVILLDISMPVLDGLSALAELNRLAREQGKQRPRAIAFTANVMADQVAEYRAAGFAGHIAKPLQKADLISQIARVAGRQNA